MATGDIKNNIRKLKNSLKSIRYGSPEDIDITCLTEGSPTVYLPIYHYAFLQYSPKVAESILNFELFGKSDARFMEVLYKILRDVFSYKSPVNKEQFFMKGFAERKIIMCTEIVQLVKKKHTQLNPGTSRTAMKTSVRPKTAVESRNPKAAPNLKRPSSTKISPRYADEYPRNRQVVNELVSVPAVPAVRHTAHIYNRKELMRHVACRTDEEIPRPFTYQDVPVIEHNTRTQFQEPVNDRITDRFTDYHSGRYEDEQLPTPFAYKDVPVIENNTRTQFQEPANDGFTDRFTDYHSGRHEGINHISQKHSTEIKSKLQSGINHEGHRTVWVSPEGSSIQTSIHGQSNINQDISIVDVGAAVPDIQGFASMCKTVEDLSLDLKQQFDDAMISIQDESIRKDAFVEKLGARIQQQLDNINAQMVLMDNRLQIVEFKVDSLSNTNTHLPTVPPVQPGMRAMNKNVPIPAQDSSFSTERNFLDDPRVKQFSEESVNVSMNYSPIRKSTNGMDGGFFTANEDTFVSDSMDEDRRRSSTPTGGKKAEPSFLCAATRIEKMVQSTNQMLQDKPEIPDLRNNGD